ncbi:MAG: ABC transporter permease subunit [Phycisphaerales bacterium]|nr:MAG: ABC transporter permease subunit [Phycisphaerales bacterium]
MIWKIAQKEFLLNLISARFAVGFLLCLFLIPFTVTVNIDDYANRMRVYRADRDNAERDLREVRVYSELRPEVVKPPDALSIFCQGISGNVGNRVKIWLGEKPLFAAGNVTVRNNPLLNSFFSIDFIGIVAIVVSLLALIFTYDACTKEKEDGTLRLQLANSLGRSDVLLGKLAGVCLTLLPIVVFCYLLSFLCVLMSEEISFSAGEWGRILLLFLTSLTYFLVFAFIGILVSTRVKSSTTSIIVCLFLWVLFVFIIPNLAVYLAVSMKRIRSLDNLNYALAELNSECWRKRNEYNAQLDPPDWGMNWNNSGGPDGRRIVGGCSKSKFERYLKEHEFSEPLRIDYADKKWPLQRAYLGELDDQRKLAERIALVSPSETFRLVCRALCRTDVASQHGFMDRVRRYREEVVGYFEDKKLFSSYLYFTPHPPETFKTPDEIVRIRTGGEYKTLREYWASGSGFAGLRKVEIPESDPGSYPFLDVSDVPRFQWQSADLMADVGSVITKIGILVLAGVSLFCLSFVSFIRCDVR